MTDPKPPQDLADEYVLGLLTDAEAAAVEARLETDPALRAAVADSRDRFLELDLTAQPAALEDRLWDAVEQRLASPQPAPVATAPATAPANDNLRRWRSAALTATAASAVLALGLGWSLFNRPDPEVIAVLLNESGAPVALIEDFAGPEAQVTPLVDFAAAADRSYQLWTLPPGAAQPVSLGVWDDGQSALVRAGARTPAEEGQLYEISLEQRGGSPTGLPTGPILGKGFAAAPR